MTKREYERLVESAGRKGDIQLSLIMQTICSTGIRVSELSSIHARALADGYACVNNKGKSRIIFLPKDLIRLLKTYCRQVKITSGPIFLSQKGKPIDRSVVWRKMKRLCKDAKIDEKKYFLTISVIYLRLPSII